MATTLQDLLNATNDNIGSYSTGITADDIKKRAINRAIEWVKRTIGIPTDEKVQTILFSADQKYYDLNADVDEGLMVIYSDEDYNTEQYRWEYYNYPDILHTTGGLRTNRWSITYINGTKQLVLHANNLSQGNTLLTMDSVTDWTASDDAIGIAIDTNQKYEGTGSISFDITNSAGVATIYNDNVTLDIESLIENHGYIKFWQYLTDSNIDIVTLKLIDDVSNYYTITATVADDGTDFAQDAWQKVGFALDDAVVTGSPDPSGITKVQIEFDLGAGFTSAADFRVDYMFSTVPDSVDFIYYTANKGTDTTGATAKTELSEVTDIPSWSGVHDDISEVVSQRAAVVLWPQLRGDKEAYMLLVQDLKENMKTFARRWPRKRLQGQTKTYLRR